MNDDVALYVAFSYLMVLGIVLWRWCSLNATGKATSILCLLISPYSFPVLIVLIVLWVTASD